MTIGPSPNGDDTGVALRDEGMWLAWVPHRVGRCRIIRGARPEATNDNSKGLAMGRHHTGWSFVAVRPPDDPIREGPA